MSIEEGTDVGKYVGRLAPTPSGHLHVGHAQTFALAWLRAQQMGGNLILRIEDLDAARCKSVYLDDMVEDLDWFGLSWHTIGKNPLEFTSQSQRFALYKRAWSVLLQKGYIYPSPHSRKDVDAAISAPHEGDQEAIFPVTLRPSYVATVDCGYGNNSHFPPEVTETLEPTKVNWRFRVPDGEEIEFTDARCGQQKFTAGVDFGDFLVWRWVYIAQVRCPKSSLTSFFAW